ncbi:hypothetical protein EMIHUDRAFT_236345 [Emiliania huxleyi CCMP1516]|uniref:EXPERA domain-containing protein n=2 Tax=Emiliania huxleyi TaxID=2903 RepID=A0A0D3JTS8_EMIH1|nr:hypothetical protein EMIHUDRAFT_236345 [Emiliania huxleyi CCMP1516]EOD26913.1 hypothetical protein EMIHUDRAFT_236345 [Emiliania huxleyi CCMP1516]|eukprot:XP_005779342.1 hypothetical protein EMIHUDRAFT_236345 [Emiliania huxleyi CCMP1516]
MWPFDYVFGTPEPTPSLLPGVVVELATNAVLLALESRGDHDDDVKWLTFWFAYSFVNFAGSLFSNVFFFIPFWGEVLLGTTVFLALGGSKLVLKPILLKNQEVIDKVLSKGAALKDKVVAKAA